MSQYQSKQTRDTVENQLTFLVVFTQNEAYTNFYLASIILDYIHYITSSERYYRVQQQSVSILSNFEQKHLLTIA